MELWIVDLIEGGDDFVSIRGRGRGHIELGGLPAGLAPDSAGGAISNVRGKAGSNRYTAVAIGNAASR
jgi:hypothetical protein